MPLRSLVLLDVVDEHLQPAVDAAVIEVEAEAANLERLAAAFVLSGVDAGASVRRVGRRARRASPVDVRCAARWSGRAPWRMTTDSWMGGIDELKPDAQVLRRVTRADGLLSRP